MRRLGACWALAGAFALALPSEAASKCLEAFTGFLARFETEPQFQASRIKFPLRYTFVDNESSTGPKTKRTVMSKSEHAARRDPVFPLVEAQQSHLLEKTVRNISASRKTVKLIKDGTSFELVYHFRKSSACWRLESYENWSV